MTSDEYIRHVFEKTLDMDLTTYKMDCAECGDMKLLHDPVACDTCGTLEFPIRYSIHNLVDSKHLYVCWRCFRYISKTIRTK
jgi:hypothetical protein